MSELISFRCVLLRPGFQVDVDESTRLPLEWKDDFEPDLTSGNTLFVYEPEAPKDERISDFDDWNKTELQNWDKLILEQPAFLISYPEGFKLGLHIAGEWNGHRSYILECMGESSYDEVKDCCEMFYDECIRALNVAQTSYELEKVSYSRNRAIPLIDPSKAPYVNISFLTLWSAWSSQSYEGEWDGGIDFKKFIYV